MSKSSGNGIDPILLIDKYGSDALRFALIREVAGAGQDIRLDFDRKKIHLQPLKLQEILRINYGMQLNLC